jgi:hypothetical protein
MVLLTIGSVVSQSSEIGGPSLTFLTMAFKEYCDTSGSGGLPFETVVENTTVFPEELEILTEETCGTGLELMGEKAVATATLDRLLHHSNVFIMKGESYRLKNRIKHGLVPKNI